MKKIAVICSPTARRQHKNHLEAYFRSLGLDKKAQKRNPVIYLTTDHSMHLIINQIKACVPTNVIIIDVPIGSANKIHADCAKMESSPAFAYVTTNIVRHNVDPLNEAITVYDSPERLSQQLAA